MPDISVLILFYSMTGATAGLARCVARGVESVTGARALVKRVPELMPDEIFAQKPELDQWRKQLQREFPEVATIDDLVAADAVAFGTPVRFGSFAAQIKEYLDQLSPAWLEGRLVDKPAGVFCSAGTLHGGEEMTLISLMIPLLNLGMLPVGLPYAPTSRSMTFDAASPYGAIVVTGKDGQQPLTKDHEEAAMMLGQRLARLAIKLKQL